MEGSLHAAARDGDVAALAALLAKGADIDERGPALAHTASPSGVGRQGGSGHRAPCPRLQPQGSGHR